MNEISDNLLAAFLAGNTSPEDTVKVLEAARTNQELRKVIELSIEMDEEELREERNVLPMQSLAAHEEENRCAVLCELYVLARNGVTRSLKDWEKQAVRQGWLKDGGMPIYHIGRLLEQECFSTSRTFHNTLPNLKDALTDSNVIAVVDGKELIANKPQIDKEAIEDLISGPYPNHAIVVLNVDLDRAEVEFYDPSIHEISKISSSRFLDAWQDSSNYMVTVSKRNLRNYEPHPIDLSDTELPADLEDLQEALAENAHEVWAQGRKNQGWTYGPRRDDTLKQTPDMVPYSDLSDQEKFFDREMAMNTLKLLKKLGYKIVKE